MSWVTKIQDDISIETGDGRVYTPIYSFYKRSFEFNFTEYNYPNIRGSKIDRRLKRSDRYEMMIVFQGADHLDEAKEFLTSAENKKYWLIRHPLFEEFICHPTSLTQDVAGLNTSVITGALIETISDDFPKSEDAPAGFAQDYAVGINNAAEDIFSGPPLSSQEQQLMSENLEDTGEEIKGKIKLQDQLDEYFNLFNEATNAVVNATSFPLKAIQTVRNVYTYPFQLKQTVKDRLTMLVGQFNTVISEITNIVTPNEKKIIETNAGLTLSAMFLTAINPLNSDDYENATDVIGVSDLILDNFNLYISIVDGFQTPTNDETDSYVPNFDMMYNLFGGIYFVVSNLSEVALHAKQQRIVSLDFDSNIILLTHRFYGLDSEDENMDRFIRNNNIGLNELLTLKKGREVIYYV